MLFAQIGEGLGGILGVLMVAWGLAEMARKFSKTSDETKKNAAKNGVDFIKWLFK